MDHTQPIRRFSAGIRRPLAVALIAPAVIVASAAVLAMLLGIFVLWLAIVGVLVAGIVIADVARRSARRLAPTPFGAFSRQAVGIR